MRAAIRMQLIRQRQLGEIGLTVERESIEIMKMGVIGGALLCDAPQFIAG